jgi:hypothetical protein
MNTSDAGEQSLIEQLPDPPNTELDVDQSEGQPDAKKQKLGKADV